MQIVKTIVRSLAFVGITFGTSAAGAPSQAICFNNSHQKLNATECAEATSRLLFMLKFASYNQGIPENEPFQLKYDERKTSSIPSGVRLPLVYVWNSCQVRLLSRMDSVYTTYQHIGSAFAIPFEHCVKTRELGGYISDGQLLYEYKKLER
jgi:hypothetical protein